VQVNLENRVRAVPVHRPPILTERLAAPPPATVLKPSREGEGFNPSAWDSEKEPMRKEMVWSCIIVVGALASRRVAAQGQPPPAAAPPPPAPPSGAAPPPAAPSPEASPPAAPPPAASPPAAAPPAAPEVKWYEKIKFGAFVDVYASINYNFPKPQSSMDANVPNVPVNRFRAYDVTNGFAIQWAGLEASFSPDPIGGQVSLRFGPGANLHNTGDAASSSLINLKQAYATWKPFSKLFIDFGKYDQPFGSEVPETQFDINYTRSALFWLAQPLYFTGFRVDIPVVDSFDVKLFLANGWNNSIDNNQGKSAGLQLTIKPKDKLSIAAGYMVGPEQADVIPPAPASGNPPTNNPNADQRLRHLADLVVDWHPDEKFRALLNGSFGLEDTPFNQQLKWGGVNLALKFAPTDRFYVALRVEFYKDPNGFTSINGLLLPASAAALAGLPDVTIEDGTLTLGFNPTPNLLLKLDQRLDHASPRTPGVFLKGITDHTEYQVTTTLGVVATTN
jgi:hypothetical protein